MTPNHFEGFRKIIVFVRPFGNSSAIYCVRQVLIVAGFWKSCFSKVSFEDVFGEIPGRPRGR